MSNISTNHGVSSSLILLLLLLLLLPLPLPPPPPLLLLLFWRSDCYEWLISIIRFISSSQYYTNEHVSKSNNQTVLSLPFSNSLRTITSLCHRLRYFPLTCLSFMFHLLSFIYYVSSFYYMLDHDDRSTTLAIHSDAGPFFSCCSILFKQAINQTRGHACCYILSLIGMNRTRGHACYCILSNATYFLIDNQLKWHICCPFHFTLLSLFACFS